jgi:hypothetical protein
VISDVLIALLLKTHAFWVVTLPRSLFPGVGKGRSAFVLRTKQYMSSVHVGCRVYYVQPTTLQRLECSTSTVTDAERSIQNILSLQNKKEMKLYAFLLIITNK